MDKQSMNDIPFIAYEASMARMERTVKRLWVLCIIIFAAFVISNAAWVHHETKEQMYFISGETTGCATSPIIYFSERKKDEQRT